MKCISFLSKVIQVALIFCCLFSTEGYAQNTMVYEDDVSTVFTAGGYGALFGAAMGAAILPFIKESPMENIRLVAGGASIGFMVGSIYGFYTLANAKQNSYFNYTPQDEDSPENNYYYSMPPTYPTQGYNSSDAPTPLVGALLMTKGTKVSWAIPYFWVGNKNVEILLADMHF